MKQFRQKGIILFITIILFFLVSMVLPSESFIEIKRNIPTDPVAVFDRLKSYSENKQWYQNFELDSIMLGKLIGRNSEKIILYKQELKPFSVLKYHFSIDNDPCLELGFLLEPNSEGTMLTYYMLRTNLNYPFGRWRGLLMPVIMRNPLKKYLIKLNKDLVE